MTMKTNDSLLWHCSCMDGSRSVGQLLMIGFDKLEPAPAWSRCEQLWEEAQGFQRQLVPYEYGKKTVYTKIPSGSIYQ